MDDNSWANRLRSKYGIAQPMVFDEDDEMDTVRSAIEALEDNEAWGGEVVRC